MTADNATRVVSIGVDTAIVADHQIAIRGPGIREDFRVAPTLASLAKLTERLEPFSGSLVVAEPTGGSWIALSQAVADAGCAIGYVHESVVGEGDETVGQVAESHPNDGYGPSTGRDD